MAYPEDQYPQPELIDEKSEDEIFNAELLAADDKIKAEKEEAIRDEKSFEKFIGHER